MLETANEEGDMKITGISVYKTGLPYVGGTYVWGAGNAISTAMASVVVIDTDAGLQGCGEFTPCGENYMIAHSRASRRQRVCWRPNFWAKIHGKFII